MTLARDAMLPVPQVLHVGADPSRELTKSIGYMRLLNALNYAPVIAAMAERGETAKLNWHRARFAGDFNLYQ